MKIPLYIVDCTVTAKSSVSQCSKYLTPNSIFILITLFCRPFRRRKKSVSMVWQKRRWYNINWRTWKKPPTIENKSNKGGYYRNLISEYWWFLSFENLCLAYNVTFTLPKLRTEVIYIRNGIWTLLELISTHSVTWEFTYTFNVNWDFTLLTVSIEILRYLQYQLIIDGTNSVNWKRTPFHEVLKLLGNVNWN